MGAFGALDPSSNLGRAIIPYGRGVRGRIPAGQVGCAPGPLEAEFCEKPSGHTKEGQSGHQHGFHLQQRGVRYGPEDAGPDYIPGLQPHASAFSGVPSIAFWLHKMASIFPDLYLSNLDRQIWLEAVGVGNGIATLQELAVFLAR